MSVLTKVYHPTKTTGVHVLAIAPAAEDRTARVDDWLDEEGRPKTLRVEFRDGEAFVASPLARFLTATGRAKRSRLLSAF